ncbi:4-oxalocrotonate tautomerase family protein [Zoogloea sp.]|jgi:4-oxalocrotonate tautomerase|uniref:tautomerase family protein n=1 Tax=Zoogloea sp. TaxID=49181 RepID=UPI0035AF57D6
MPYLKLAYASPAAVAAADLAATLTRITVDLLGKQRELTVVALEPLPPAGWFVGGAALGEGQSGAVLEIRITEGTNTKAQKAAFVRAAFDALATALPGLHPASYVTLHEPPADAWGYAGQTQEFRFIRSQLL